MGLGKGEDGTDGMINSKEEIARWQKLYGAVTYQGAWNEHKVKSVSGSNNAGAWNSGTYHGPFEVPDPLPEGNPTLKLETEDAAHFMIRMVHQYPHEVTIYAGGPLTNLAQAVSIDHVPSFSTAREIGSQPRLQSCPETLQS